jgi:hypothetical protein
MKGRIKQRLRWRIFFARLGSGGGVMRTAMRSGKQCNDMADGRFYIVIFW